MTKRRIFPCLALVGIRTVHAFSPSPTLLLVQRNLPRRRTTQSVVGSQSHLQNNLGKNDSPSFSFLENDSSSSDDSILDFLIDNGKQLPPVLKDLVILATQQYRFQTPSSKGFFFDEVMDMMEEEHAFRNVPVLVKNKKVTSQYVSSVLSVAALYKLPLEITLPLLQAPAGYYKQPTMVSMIQQDFVECGWSCVSFPKGLAVRPKTKYRFNQETVPKAKRLPLSWRHRTSTLAKAARIATQCAAETRAPPPIDRAALNTGFMESMEPNHTATSSFLTPPSSNNGKRLLRLAPTFPKRPTTKRLRKFFQKSYRAMKEQGRAGVLGYCFFNFCWYSFGTLWQWRTVKIGTPTTTTSASLFRLVITKYTKVFGILLAVSQLLKLPKILTAIALAPVSSKVLGFVKDRFNINEGTATVMVISCMVLAWLVLTCIPILNEIASIRRTLSIFKEQQFAEVYGTLQPV